MSNHLWTSQNHWELEFYIFKEVFTFCSEQNDHLFKCQIRREQVIRLRLRTTSVLSSLSVASHSNSVWQLSSAVIRGWVTLADRAIKKRLQINNTNRKAVIAIARLFHAFNLTGKDSGLSRKESEEWYVHPMFSLFYKIIKTEISSELSEIVQVKLFRSSFSHNVLSVFEKSEFQRSLFIGTENETEMTIDAHEPNFFILKNNVFHYLQHLLDFLYYFCPKFRHLVTFQNQVFKPPTHWTHNRTHTSPHWCLKSSPYECVRAHWVRADFLRYMSVQIIKEAENDCLLVL